MLRELTIAPGIIRAISEASSLDDLHSWLASAIRGPRGLIVVADNRDDPPRPDEPLQLFEYEASPRCRKVREAMTELDLAYISRCRVPGAETTGRQTDNQGGEQPIPLLIDPNTGRHVGDAEQIITYLADTYGPGRSRPGRLLAPVNTAASVAATLVRPRGRHVRPGLGDRTTPDELPILYNIEASPYCRKVRETFSELHLDYHVKNVGKFSPRRPELVERGGQMMVPYLIDPNHDVEMYQSDDIVAYLTSTYGAP